MTQPSPSIVHPGALTELPAVLATYGRRVALFAGSGAATTGELGRRLAQALHGFDVTPIDGFAENPRLEDVVRAVRELRLARADAVLAVGGGTVLDVAKCANAIAAHAHEPQAIVEGRRFIEHAGLPLVAVPTTAGSGSEATQFAVVYVGHRKHSVDHASLLPSVAIVDAELTASVPGPVAAASGLDALAHGIESYWAVSSTEWSRQTAAEAVRMAIAALPGLVTAPTPAAREQMSRAAHLAGQAINVTRTTAAHALSYSLTARHAIRHGHAVAMLLGAVMESNARVTATTVADPRGAGFVRRCVADLLAWCGASNPPEFSFVLAELLRTAGLAPGLAEAGLNRESSASIAATVNAERLANNPRRLTVSELAAIVEASWDASPAVAWSDAR